MTKDFRHEIHVVRSVLMIVIATIIIPPLMEYLQYAEHFAIINDSGSYRVGTTYHSTVALGARHGDKPSLALSRLVFTTSL